MKFGYTKPLHHTVLIVKTMQFIANPTYIKECHISANYFWMFSVTYSILCTVFECLLANQ
ncbi:hypothetical protein Vspart_03584 [Vibrio spartinae]|uniref:Uncharacterized protein n=1 Tax=Vibrio spartinae TaxID=1918945 RepID=A0ABX6R3W9_9VIBR|nr:hypothetical protein Vspart_03584 [Vibrio spartinae]